MPTPKSQTERTNFDAPGESRRRVKEPVEARQGTRPSTMAAVLFISLALAALVGVFLASAFSF